MIAVDIATRDMLRAGLMWLYETAQPEGALDQHHGHSRAVGERVYTFVPRGYLNLPVVVVDVRHPEWVHMGDGHSTLANPLDYPGELRRLGEVLADLGRPVASQWNGKGDSGSLGLADPAHPSLVAAVNRYRDGCPIHRTVFCGGWQASKGEEDCTWFRDGQALMVPPCWPV